jgi:hypothetical protein
MMTSLMKCPQTESVSQIRHGCFHPQNTTWINRVKNYNTKSPKSHLTVRYWQKVVEIYVAPCPSAIDT